MKAGVLTANKQHNMYTHTDPSHLPVQMYVYIGLGYIPIITIRHSGIYRTIII